MFFFFLDLNLSTSRNFHVPWPENVIGIFSIILYTLIILKNVGKIALQNITFELLYEYFKIYNVYVLNKIHRFRNYKT